jgi:hypothetical protein
MAKLELHMNEKTSFQDLQKEFSTEYPFLKIDFFKFVGNNLGWLTRMEKILGIDKVAVYYRTVSLKSMNIHRERTVTQLISEIEDNLYVRANVQRKSGSMWIATSLTTNWTLEQQNREGKFLSQ